ncbi:hypothetical protein PUNSTDRAFT_104608 [Punctularia strigosozonata HHB-11173 SS5]|uniref:uncharacterized protein n=1 Tax=Punctularia strigosozonata (strain HHB-11173) TaxID=741275 RepID=UPI0004417A4D|nr:uncharacterized protein PUNSTDRAFT_104608 [Punctularia strigosozonata HHB-11173 SS5]EIN07103.1 hypothetical protein PUNSTDRAFT_104608 [Punctularia strigosozonata HHB-11173 SS5]
MAAAATLKILTVGPAAGSIRDLFAKVKSIDAKHGKFDLLLCVGDFFGKEQGSDTQDLLEDKLEVPMECYVMQGGYALPTPVIEKYAKTGGELCKNVFLLAKSAMVTTPQGLKIACLGGVYDSVAYVTSDSAPGFHSAEYSRQTVDKLLANISGPQKNKNYKSLTAIQSAGGPSELVDILITNSWPTSITEFSSLPVPDLLSPAAPAVDVVMRRAKPRYHFSASRLFWEREPFVWDDEQGRVSRFVSLGAFAGQPLPEGVKKQRWFYAFSITPLEKSTASALRPANATRNPILEAAPRGEKRQFDSGENFRWGGDHRPAPNKRSKPNAGDKPGVPPQGYKCKICESAEHFINDCPDRAKPPEGYVCKICSEPGHFVRDCPTKHAVGDTGGRKPRPGYICRACGSEEHYIEDCPTAQQRRKEGGEKRKGPMKEIAPEECWFCLSNPNLSKYLIVAVGTECYVTLPKGQIIPTHDPQHRPDSSMVPGGGHCLIVPIAHYATLASMAPDIAGPTIQEVERYKSALRAFYAKYHHAAVFFEVGRLSGRGGHAHVQAVPVPLNLKERVQEAFTEHGRAKGIQFEVDDAEAAMTSCKTDNRSYFRVDLPDGRVMVHLMPEHGRFDLQFGRFALTSLLGIPNRLDWKACVQPEEEDRADAEAFKMAFAPFDQTMQLF